MRLTHVDGARSLTHALRALDADRGKALFALSDLLVGW
jgi:hypothetical protein